MARQWALNQQVTTTPLTGLATWKDKMVLAGSAVMSSGDGGSTYSSSGDVHAFTANTAWFRLRSSTGWEFVVQRVTNAFDLKIWFSPSAGFTGGSPNATTPPTATDSQAMFTGGQAFKSGGRNYVFQIMADDAKGFFVVAYVRTEETSFVFALDPFQASSYPPGMARPYAIWWGGTGSSTDFLQGGRLSFISASNQMNIRNYINDGAGGQTFQPVGLMAPFLGNASDTFNRRCSDGDASASLVVDPDGNGEPCMQAIYGRDATSGTPAGYRGTSSLFAFTGTPTSVHCTTLNVLGTKDYCRFDDLLLQWDGSTAPDTSTTGTPASPANVDAFMFVTGGTTLPDTAAPVISLVSPSNGSSLQPADTVTIDITDDTRVVAVFVEVAYPGGQADAVYDGAYSAPFSSSTLPVNVTAHRTLAIRRNGGWARNAVSFTVTAIDGGGNVATAGYSFTVDLSVLSALAVAVSVPSQPPRDILIDELTNDMALTATGDIAWVGGIDSIAQAVRQRLRTFRGEWFMDDTVGVPWGEILGQKAPNIPAAREIIRGEILAVPGVLDVTRLTINLDVPTREMDVSFIAPTDLGELVVNGLKSPTVSA